MSRFRRRPHEVPGLNLAAMPDLIFTVLFFFMIVTHMRDVEPLVRYDVPQGTELEKAGRKSGMLYLFIGQPLSSQTLPASSQTLPASSQTSTTSSQASPAAAEPCIQLNNRIVSLAELEREVAAARSRLSEEDRQHMVVSIRADRNTDMGLINDVKQALRRAGALNINYSATKKKHY